MILSSSMSESSDTLLTTVTASGSFGSAPQSIPHFEHPSHRLLKENGFQQQIYSKFHQKCLKGKVTRNNDNTCSFLNSYLNLFTATVMFNALLLAVLFVSVYLIALLFLLACSKRCQLLKGRYIYHVDKTK